MSLQLFLFDRLFRALLKRRFAKRPDVIHLREVMGELGVKRQLRIPDSIRVESTLLGGVRTEVLRPADSDPARALLYIHGGAFVAGSPQTHRPITWRLARALGRAVYAVDYRLAPEHPFPAGLDDVVAAYRALLEEGLSPAQLAVAGDSAGGNLTLALALRLKQLGVPLPGALVCLSPATDFNGQFASRASCAESDAMFDPQMFASAGKHYCPGADLANPLLSPLRGDLRGLPKTLIFCSAIEMLRDDSVEMAAAMKAAGVEVQLEVWPKVFHAWPVVADFIPESKRAIAQMAAFMRAATA